MNIVETLQGEEEKLKTQLVAIREAIAALNGVSTWPRNMRYKLAAGRSKGTRGTRTVPFTGVKEDRHPRDCLTGVPSGQE